MTSTVPRVSSSLETAHHPSLVQRIEVRRELAQVPQLEVFKHILADKRVLHVSYAASPTLTLADTLHGQLDAVCAELDGVELNGRAAAAIGPHIHGALMASLDEVTASYDVLLVPDVIERIGDVASLLASLDRVSFDEVLLTAPDAYSCRGFFDYLPARSGFVEVVHPDHHCWFTPYTLSNLVAKFTPWSIESVWFLNGDSLLLVASKRPRPATDDPPPGGHG